MAPAQAAATEHDVGGCRGVTFSEDWDSRAYLLASHLIFQLWNMQFRGPNSEHFKRYVSPRFNPVELWMGVEEMIRERSRQLRVILHLECKR